MGVKILKCCINMIKKFEKVSIVLFIKDYIISLIISLMPSVTVYTILRGIWELAYKEVKNWLIYLGKRSGKLRLTMLSTNKACIDELPVVVEIILI